MQTHTASTDTSRAPKISFGIPVRNGVKDIGATIDSLLAQDLDDFEIVISDNCSDDGTQDLLKSYAAKDARVRLALNTVNIGQDGNFNRVLELARGEYFRWVGVEDTLDPHCASKSVEVLDAYPDVVSVSAFTRFVDGAGKVHYAEYMGERTESDKPHRRYARTLWLLLADYRYFDPIYNVYRRSVLMNTRRLRSVPVPDQTLSLELALMGRSLHIPLCLSTRYRDPAYYDNKRELAVKYNPKNPGVIHAPTWYRSMHFGRLAWEADLSLGQKLLCTVSAVQYFVKRSLIEGSKSLRRSIPAWVKRPIKHLRPARTA